MTICKQWVKYENMKKECLIAQWRIHDHMQAVGQIWKNMKKECLIAQWRIYDHMQAVGQI